jgi:2-polyprenyl-3-methyl-5-hydroxy-6-metoxy-1,4-benzoquinol methylase
MENVTRDFNKAAATWDEKPRRVKLADDVADSIAKNILLTSNMDVLDFGCGTGLLTLNLQPLVRSVTGVDNSQGMLDMLKVKAESLGATNVSAIYKDLDKGDVLDGAFHLVTSCMVFHHVKEIEALVSKFHEIILPSGYIAIADLDLDEGRFHEDSTGVFHNGFDRDWLRQVFMDAGFDNVSHGTAASVIKPAAGGGSREFTIFLMTGGKK